MTSTNASVRWGDWGLGDLSDVFLRVADLLGRTQDVTRVVLEPPAERDGLPHLTIAVPDDDALDQVRARLTQGEYLIAFFGDFIRGWGPEGAGFELTVKKEASGDVQRHDA